MDAIVYLAVLLAGLGLSVPVINYRRAAEWRAVRGKAAISGRRVNSGGIKWPSSGHVSKRNQLEPSGSFPLLPAVPAAAERCLAPHVNSSFRSHRHRRRCINQPAQFWAF